MTFKERLLESLRRLFSSVKFITMMAGLLTYLLAKRGIILDPSDAQAIVILFGSLIGAQGLTDIGARKAQIEVVNPKPPEQVNTQNLNAALPPSETK
jgi:hypothetical protein